MSDYVSIIITSKFGGLDGMHSHKTLLSHPRDGNLLHQKKIKVKKKQTVEIKSLMALSPEWIYTPSELHYS